MSAKLTTTI